MAFLIAEISNHHHGDLNKAKELIKTARDCGADAVKGQAFDARVMAQIGSMDTAFYEKCELGLIDYHELIDYGESIGIDVFFSIISPSFSSLRDKQKYQKVFAHQALHLELDRKLKAYDKENTFISFPEWTCPETKYEKATLLCATQYNQDITLKALDHLTDKTGKQCGISHHGKLLLDLEFAITEREIPVIEKHFYLGDNIFDATRRYRDCDHSFNPTIFEILAKIYKG